LSCEDRLVLSCEALGKGRPVVAVHGFTQTRRSWCAIAQRLQADNHLTLVDAPGHGGSSQVRADLVHGADLLAHVGGRAHYLGYSMGARLCLHLALQRPDLATSLVMIGGHPGIVDSVERARRHVDDEALAARLEAEGVTTFVDEWLHQPLFSSLDPADAGRDDRLTNTVTGLASSLRLAGTGSQVPLWDRLPQLRMPVLIVAGELDAKFADLGRRAAAAIGANAEVVLIPGAGHACHLEQPDAFCAALTDFLDDVGH
jgi:2-succinyl-6-hydroxy-2,4-cyclohexadiene-1-carboxylate synthase